MVTWVSPPDVELLAGIGNKTLLPLGDNFAIAVHRRVSVRPGGEDVAPVSNEVGCLDRSAIDRTANVEVIDVRALPELRQRPAGTAGVVELLDHHLLAFVRVVVHPDGDRKILVLEVELRINPIAVDNRVPLRSGRGSRGELYRPPKLPT